MGEIDRDSRIISDKADIIGQKTVNFAVVIGVGVIIIVVLLLAFGWTNALLRRTSDDLKATQDLSAAFERIVKNSVRAPFLAESPDEALKNKNIALEEYYLEGDTIKIALLGPAVDSNGNVSVRRDSGILLDNVSVFHGPEYSLHSLYPDNSKRPPVYGGFDQRYVIEVFTGEKADSENPRKTGKKRYVIRTWVPGKKKIEVENK